MRPAIETKYLTSLPSAEVVGRRRPRDGHGRDRGGRASARRRRRRRAPRACRPRRGLRRRTANPAGSRARIAGRIGPLRVFANASRWRGLSCVRREADARPWRRTTADRRVVVAVVACGHLLAAVDARSSLQSLRPRRRSRLLPRGKPLHARAPQQRARSRRFERQVLSSGSPCDHVRRPGHHRRGGLVPSSHRLHRHLLLVLVIVMVRSVTRRARPRPPGRAVSLTGVIVVLRRPGQNASRRHSPSERSVFRLGARRLRDGQWRPPKHSRRRYGNVSQAAATARGSEIRDAQQAIHGASVLCVCNVRYDRKKSSSPPSWSNAVARPFGSRIRRRRCRPSATGSSMPSLAFSMRLSRDARSKAATGPRLRSTSRTSSSSSVVLESRY